MIHWPALFFSHYIFFHPIISHLYNRSSLYSILSFLVLALWAKPHLSRVFWGYPLWRTHLLPPMSIPTPSPFSLDLDQSSSFCGIQLGKLIVDSCGLGTNAMRNAHCAILVYDIREKSTAAKFPLWRNTLTHRGNKNIPMLVAANKVDLLPKDKPAPDEVFSRCKQMETSAKKKINTSKALRWIAHELTMQVQRPGATCRGGAENVQMQRCRCRGAEVQRLCRGVGAEQVCRVCAEVQSICKGSGEVIVQAIVQRCRYGVAATYMQRCR